jgi:hypothetical protein
MGMPTASPSAHVLPTSRPCHPSRFPGSLVLIVALLLPASSAPACPQCPAGVARQVRAGIYDGDFAFNLFATLLPFGVFLGITAAIHSGVAVDRLAPRGRRQDR